METYIFIEGGAPLKARPDFQSAIFNTLSFFALQDTSPLTSFYMLDQKKNTVSAGIHFHITERVARSPLRAPFGSVECSEEINPAHLYRFLEFVEQQLREKGVSEVHIKNPPRAYFPERMALIEVFLTNQNFSIVDSEVTAVIPIEDGSFADGIRHSEKLRIRQARKQDFSFQRIPMEQIGEVFHFIAACHLEKGYKLSIGLADLQKATAQFPDHYLLFGIFAEGKMVAASVSIRVYSHVLYNFLVNHEKQYSSLSPALLLMEGIYGYCVQNGITLFDLGTSALNGKPNFPLLDFKLHIGGKPSSKVAFFKKLK